MFQFFNQGEIELIIDTETQEVWTTNLALAKMAKCSPQAICKRVQKSKIAENRLSIKSLSESQGSKKNTRNLYRLLPLEFMLDVLAEKSPDIYNKLIDLLIKRNINIPKHETAEQKKQRFNDLEAKRLAKKTPSYNEDKQSLYLVRNMETGNLKIGIAVAPEKRLIGLQSGNEYELRLLKQIHPQDLSKYKVKFAKDLEAQLIQKFIDLDLCIRNEWFKEDQRIYDFFDIKPEDIDKEKTYEKKVVLHGRSSKLAQRIAMNNGLDLEHIHIKELRKRAKKANIKYSYKMTKPKLIEELRRLENSN